MTQSHNSPQHPGYIVIACALESEMSSIYTSFSGASSRKLIYSNQRQRIEKLSLSAIPHELLLVTSGVGIAHAASAAAHAIHWVHACEEHVHAYISAGTCGGMHGKVHVGDVILGDSYTHLKADATACGYELGQIPQMPAQYQAAPQLLEHSLKSCPQAVCGTIVSSDAFITADDISAIQQHFPKTIAADMESAAIAQVCWNESIPFISIRSVSDLCSAPEQAGEDFKKGEIDASLLSAQACLAVLQSLDEI